jgi:homoserine O-acetyltransferase
MPAEKDLYSPPEDNAYEVRHMPNTKVRVIPGVWGHFAGGGIDANQTDTRVIDDALKKLLAQKM